jgi:CDP-diacylglycerol--glycerol-3-phosphate 3-phosphatidyltransferase
LVPALVVLLLEDTSGTDLAAGAVFGLASATDALDGHLARTREEVTNFGKLADPLADKLLVLGALVCLVSLGRLAWVAAALVVLREVVVTVARTRASRRGVVAPARPLGKLKTAAQIVMVLVLILAGDSAWVDAVVVVAVALTLVSGADMLVALRREEAREASGMGTV